MEMLRESYHVTIIDVDSLCFVDIEETQMEHYRKHLISTIIKSHLLKITSSNPTFATLKSSAAAEEEATYDLAKGRTARPVLKNNSPVPECIKEALNPDNLTMSHLVEEEKPPPPEETVEEILEVNYDCADKDPHIQSFLVSDSSSSI